MKSKRFFLTRSKTENILVQGEVAYKSEINLKKVVTKKNKTIMMICPEIVEPNIITPTKAKVDDVSKLLQTPFGTDWKNLPHLTYLNTFGDVAVSLDEGNMCEHGFEEVSNFV